MKKLNLLLLLTCCIFCFSGILNGQFRRPINFNSTEITKDYSVTFKILAPKANDVKLNFQFLKSEMPMQKDSLGIWSCTVKNVVPDIYPYHFVVDGIRVADPKNSWIFPNEGFQNSLIEIEGSQPLSSAIKNIPHGTVSYRYYYSKELGMRPIVIYTPAGYETDINKKYPVLFLLHGSTDTEETWTKVGRTNIILDNLIYEGKANPMIIVMPYGRAYPLVEKENGSLRDWINLQHYSNDFLTNIYPFVQKNYRILEDKNSHAIAGFSGGGGESLYIGLSNPDKFAWVCGFAPGMLKNEIERNNAVAFANPAATNKNLKLFWIGCGTEDMLYNVIQDYTKVLDEKKIKYKTFYPGGGHTWMNCRLYLTEVSQLLFK